MDTKKIRMAVNPIQTKGVLTPNPSVMEAFVDGSYNPFDKIYGAGCVIFHNGNVMEITDSGDDLMRIKMANVSGEIQAAMNAMKLAHNTQGVTQLVIYHDYTCVADWCTGKSKPKALWAKLYKDYYYNIKQNIKIHFVKCKAHSGDVLHNWADQLAKEACRCRNIN